LYFVTFEFSKVLFTSTTRLKILLSYLLTYLRYYIISYRIITRECSPAILLVFKTGVMTIFRRSHH